MTHPILAREANGAVVKLFSPSCSPRLLHRNEAAETPRVAKDGQLVRIVRDRGPDCALDPVRADDDIGGVRRAVGEMEDTLLSASFGRLDTDAALVEVGDASRQVLDESIQVGRAVCMLSKRRSIGCDGCTTDR